MENMAELDTGNSKDYNIKAIWDSEVYVRKSKSHIPPLFYYLIMQKGYSEEKNIEKPVLAVQYLQKLISTFYKDYLNKVNTILPLIDTTPSIGMPTKLLGTKQKQNQLTKISSTNKRIKQN